MATLEDAIVGLRQALEAPTRQRTWRWLVRNRMAGVKDALHQEHSAAKDAWLAARVGTLTRERTNLLNRLAALGPAVLESDDLDHVRRELRRMLSDLEHHRQRVNDLVYDTVSLELGGSE